MKVEDITKRVLGIHEAAAKHLPNTVHCQECGRTQAVDPAECLRTGWPTCCTQTMNLGAQ